MSKKSDQIKMIPMWIRGLSRKYGIEIKRIRLDNSGENRSLQKAPGTPQQNSVVERKIPTLVERARGMLIQAGVNAKNMRILV